MQDDWNDLQVFLALERGQTARAAANGLKCSHSTVLRRLDSFEQRIGARLFDRTPDGFMLTEVGNGILDRARQVESEMLELSRLVDGSDIRLKGPIRLTVPPVLAKNLLLPSLIRFKEDYPLIDVELVVTYAYSDLSRRDADLAIRFTDNPEDHFIGRSLPPFRDAIYASKDYIEKHWRTEKPFDLSWISWPDKDLFRSRVKNTPFSDVAFGWTMPTMPTQTEAAKQGLGLAFLPCIVGDPEPELDRVPGTSTYDGRKGWILYHPDLKRMERVRVFAKFLADEIAKQAKFVGGEAFQ